MRQNSRTTGRGICATVALAVVTACGIPVLAPAALADSAVAQARTPRRFSLALAVLTALAVVLASSTPTPARAAVNGHPPVYHLLQKPVLATWPIKASAPNASTTTLYYICLSSASQYCMAPGISPGDIGIYIGDGIALAALIWKIVTNSKGQETPQDEGEVYKGKHEKGNHFLQCLTGYQTGTERVNFTTNCFGNYDASWFAESDNPPTNTKIDYYNVESDIRHGSPANLAETRRAGNGAEVYNRIEAAGYWSTWSFYFAGTCTGC